MLRTDKAISWRERSSGDTNRTSTHAMLLAAAAAVFERSRAARYARPRRVRRLPASPIDLERLGSELEEGTDGKSREGNGRGVRRDLRAHLRRRWGGDRLGRHGAARPRGGRTGTRPRPRDHGL